MQQGSEGRLFGYRAAAKYLGICPRTLAALKASGTIPYVRIGRSIRFDQDDLDNWRSVTRSAGRSAARHLSVPYDMGLHLVPDPSFPGPGVAVSPYVTEVNFVNLWRTWLDYMLADERALVGGSS